MAHKDLELSKLAGCYGYAYSLQAYNRHFQTISSILKKNQLWYKIGCGGEDNRFALRWRTSCVYNPALPPPTSTYFSYEQLDKEKLPVKVTHRRAEGTEGTPLHHHHVN